jgi:hypothetical protein
LTVILSTFTSFNSNFDYVLMACRYSFWVSSALNNRKSNASPSPGCEWAVSATAEDFVYVSYLFLRSSYFGHFGISAISCLLNQLQLCSVG